MGEGQTSAGPSRDVERTYLELRTPGQLRADDPPSPPGEIVELRPCPVAVSRALYRDVGERYHWRDRLAMSDQALGAHLASPDVRVFVLRTSRGDDGFFELVRHDDRSVEIALFGLLERAQGRGLGKWLLVQAARSAWAWAPTRVWLHTCTLDSPAALPNYIARGFTPYRTERYSVALPAATGAA